MDQSVGFSVLVVDNDERSLANLVKILVGWKYKVLTANNAHNALETLREFEGFFDIIITEFHLPGMDGFEFQKCVKDEFRLPIIMMSKDNRKDVISKSFENGVALYILKPFCANDFKDIWKYATISCNEKLILAKDLTSGEGESSSENVNSLTSSSSSSPNESEGNRKYCKRKTQDDQHNNAGRFHLLKKPKVYWDTHLHNLFLNAIKQIGVEKAVPKRILEVMNIPHLTRENVASHLQKYRLFLKKVKGKGMVEGLSHRALRSKFATSLPIAMIHDIQERYEKQRDPVQHKQSYYINPYNKVVTSVVVDRKVSTNNSYVTTQHGRSQFPYYGELLNKVLDGNSRLGRHIENNNIFQTMLKRNGNPPYNLSNNDMLSTYGGGHGLMTSQKCPSEGLNLKYGDPLYQNYGSMGNHNFSHGLGNCSMGSLSNSNILPQTCSYHPSNNFFSSIQMDNGSLMGSGFINGTQNEIINVSSLGSENFGLLQGGFVSNVGSGSEGELPATLIIAGNSSGVTEMPQQKLDDNVVGNEQQFINASSTSETEVNPIEEDPSELFLMLDDMDLFNDPIEENNFVATEFSNVEFSNSCDIVQPLDQFNGAEDVTIPPTNITSNSLDVSPTNSQQNFNELQGSGIFAKGDLDDKFKGDIIGSSNTSATEWDFDMEKIEALFGTIDD